MMTARRQRLLVVDDIPSNARILNDVLRSDYSISVATSGREALEVAAKDPPDLILLDIMMPQMDGYEVCRRLKRNRDLKEIPVIFITALDAVENKIRGFKLGAVDYITKPFEPAEIITRVRTHLALRAAREKLRKQNEELLEAAKLREDVERMARHDLKNPLTFIISVPELLLEGDNLNETQRKDIKDIKDAGYRMLEMINRSLDLFKMERGLYRFDPNPVNLAGIIYRVMDDLKSLFQAKRVEGGVKINGEIISNAADFVVRGEELLCYTLMANLIKNAVEASPEGQNITIDLFEEGEQNRISIHNAGAVPEDIREHFFDKYVTCGKSSGTGLGTYSAKLMAETQEGSIELETSEEKGTTVTVRLPKWKEPASVEEGRH